MNRVITKMRQAKYLLNRGHKVVDVDRNKYDRNRWILIFEADETLDKDIKYYNDYISNIDK